MMRGNKNVARLLCSNFKPVDETLGGFTFPGCIRINVTVIVVNFKRFLIITFLVVKGTVSAAKSEEIAGGIAVTTVLASDEIIKLL